MKKYLLLVFIIIHSGKLIAQTSHNNEGCQLSKQSYTHTRTHHAAAISSVVDTIGVSNYIISIDTIAFTAQTLRANTELIVKAKQNNVTHVPLSLLQMNIDSVLVNNSAASYTYNDTTIRIALFTALNTGDSTTIKIFYNGHPQQDASGWGGFYFSSGAAFNMGVGFDAVPHNLGKVWYPCVDEFTDKATYEFYITTPSNKKAYCNGYLNNQVANPNGTITWHWKLDNKIPTYLSSIAVGNYVSWTRNINGIPVEVAATATDTTAVANTLQHLPTAMSAFTNAYGPYPFNKVGYSLVGFGSGAMEHASNIHIGAAFMTSGLGYETLWAHELSHMWWGDNVTCSTAEDMWLNEGFASFNEAYFTQAQYGDSLYKNWIRTNHRKVLQFAHINDGGYLTMNNIPQNFTYGYHVYQKGADVVHTLRNYMGDSLFFEGCRDYHDNRAYGNASSTDLKNELTTSSGIDMTRFFDDWISTPGFPHFSIDSVAYLPGGLDHYYVYTRQKTKGNNNHIYSMPVEITFSNGIQPDTTVTVIIDSATNVFHIPLGFYPGIWVALDRKEKISDAISDFERTITSTGSVTMPETNTQLNVQNAGNGTTRIRTEHHWVAADPFKRSNLGVRLSDYHYWSVDGIWDSAFHAKCNFTYNGTISSTNGYIDNTLITGTEDSLKLFYRPNTAADWYEVTSITHNMGSATDKAGSFTVDTLKKGEYVLGYYDYTVGLQSPAEQKTKGKILSATPNPAKHTCRVNFTLPGNSSAMLQICNTKGEIIEQIAIYSHQEFIDWDCSGKAPGTYLCSLVTKNANTDTVKIVVR